MMVFASRVVILYPVTCIRFTVVTTQDARTIEDVHQDFDSRS